MTTKLSGEEKRVWERAFFAALTGFICRDCPPVTTYVAGACEQANKSVLVWRERCETDDESLARIVAEHKAAPIPICECGHAHVLHGGQGCSVASNGIACDCIKNYGRSYPERQPKGDTEPNLNERKHPFSPVFMSIFCGVCGLRQSEGNHV